MGEVIRIQDVSKRFGKKEILKNISFSVLKDSIFGLIGPNGAGKTTLLKIIAGLLKPTNGTTEISGKYGFMAEKENLYKILTVRQIFNFQNRLDSAWDISMAYELLKEANINSEMEIDDLSKGQRRIVQLIIEISSMPEVVILDEPFDGLDPIKQNWIKYTVLKQAVDGGSSICFSSNHLIHVEKLCDKVGILSSEGKLVFSGEPELIQEKFEKPLDESFIELVTEKSNRESIKDVE